MDAAPWTFHADCLRDGDGAVPDGPHEMLLILRGSYDLLGPDRDQFVRLGPGTVLYSEVDTQGGRLSAHLSGSPEGSAFRIALGLRLGLDEADPQIGSQINCWIDRHVAVVLLPVTGAPGMDRPLCRHDGLFNGFREAREI